MQIRFNIIILFMLLFFNWPFWFAFFDEQFACISSLSMRAICPTYLVFFGLVIYKYVDLANVSFRNARRCADPLFRVLQSTLQLTLLYAPPSSPFTYADFS